MRVILFLLLCICTKTFAQGEANIWYFGQNAGLDFNSGVPVALTNGQLNTDEGCATLCNSAGQLLFYTDGITVYNRNHAIMVNGSGLMGHPSTAQSATIVPKPGSTTLFYVFTIDYEGHINGFRYSIIDITLDGGLGAITSEKNILIYTPTLEGLGVTKHANGIDYLIVTHGMNNNEFRTYSLTSTGLNTSPVVSNVGLIVSGSGFDAAAIIKISPSGSKLALTSVTDFLQLFDFNNNTGLVSNAQTLLVETGELYGIQFSPNETVLYVTNPFIYITNGFYNKLYQFNLLASNIPASKLVLYSGPLAPGQLQLAPDGKIYLSIYNQTKLSVINNPDILGLGCNFQLNSIDLAGKISKGGLPSFNQAFFFTPAIQLQNACVGQNATLTFNTNQTILSATWNFGDGSPVQNSITGNHVYATPGTYPVTVTVTTPVGTGTNNRNIVISAVPTATSPPNMLICDNNNNGLYNFDLTTQNPVILNGQSDTTFKITYFANATNYSNNIPIVTPGNYQNTNPYGQQTIIAEVSNITNPDCKTTTNFIINVFDTPLPNLAINIPKLTGCDNTTVGNDTDGRIIFNLTQRAADILNGQLATQLTITYYRDAALTNQILTPTSYQNTSSVETIYAKVTNNENVLCVATTSFIIEVYPLPTIIPLITLKQCDDNTDGFSVFNLIQANSKISINFNTETFAYFETLAEAQSNTNAILNFTTYTNQTVSNDMIYVRVANSNGCFRIASLNLIVSTTQVPVTFTRNFIVCDDAIIGTNTDGVAAFNFASVDTEVRSLFPVNQLLTITYYRNLADALAENNAITNISNHRNIGYPNTQNIFTRVDSDLDNDCLLLKSFITLNVERIPVVSPITSTECDNNQDGQYPFNTAQIQTNLLNGLTNVTVTYFDENNAALPSPLPNPFLTSSQTIRVVVTNNTPIACNYESTLKFVVDDLPEAFPITLSLVQLCDDEIQPNIQDGKIAFDTTTFQNTILGTQTGMTVKYFDGNNNALPSPLPNPFVTSTQTIRVEVINPVNTSCKATSFIPFVVNPVPNIVLLDDEIVCNEKTLNKTINAGLVDESTSNDFTYVWKLDGIVLTGQSNYSLTINEEGIYTVVVTNNLGCNRTRNITVIASDKAIINNIKVTDLSNNNTIVILVSGLGVYEYSLDNQNFQSSNTFTNLEAGIYTVYVKDLNGCGISQQEVSILGIPVFFTPNGDGYHDFWNVNGISSTLNEKTIVQIFDRFGKLLKEINPTTAGWDGNFNNQPLPSSDYWYSIQLADGRKLKGHFALKR